MSLAATTISQRAVDNVQRIYAVVIALAITQAIQSLLKSPSGTALTRSEVVTGIPALVAFLFTLVPFWQGMNRHLDRCYLEKREGVVQGAILFDFFMFFGEAIFLFLAAWSLRFGAESFYYLGGLLIVDMIWATVSHRIHFRGTKSHALKWSLINIIAIVAACPFIPLQFAAKPLVLMGVAVGRSAADYFFCGDFYFPVAALSAHIKTDGVV